MVVLFLGFGHAIGEEMKASRIKTFVPKCFFFSLFLSISLFLFLSHHCQRPPPPPPSTTTATAASNNRPPSKEAQPPTNQGLKIRPGYKSYQNYIQRQLNKTLNPKLRQIWTTRDWDRKIQVFTAFFTRMKTQNYLTNSSKALCIGARVGQEVEALRRVGVSESIGMDLVPYPPLVIRGDFHHQPFENDTFDFEFSNVFDHALFPDKFIDEIERTLKPGGFCVLHVALSRRSDKYSANDLYSLEPLKNLFRGSELASVRTVDGFGLDTEVIFRKKVIDQEES